MSSQLEEGSYRPRLVGFVGLLAFLQFAGSDTVPAVSAGHSGSVETVPGGTTALARKAIVPDWTEIPYDPYPLAPAVPANPVLTKHDVTDAYAHLVADPFLFHEDGIWYMFFEAYTTRGKIALATSPNGLQWTCDRIVLDESWHQSYPMVFRYDDEYYMIPESQARDEVRLYRATDFPHSWTHCATLLGGREFVDPSVFHRDDTWWMFVGDAESASCYLFYSNELDEGWMEHPMSPIVSQNASKARPAGRALVLGDGRVIRLAQKNDVAYGEAVRVFEVDALDRQVYQEHEIPESPILQASGSGWNEEGMHHCDAWWVGNHWIAAVDGWCEEFNWSIGIYRTPFAASTGDDLAGSPEPLGAAPCYPNPSCGSVHLTYEMPESQTGVRVELGIYDLRGRLVRTLSGTPTVPGRQTMIWDGTDSEGRAVAAGSYFYRPRMAAHRITRRVVLIR